MAKLYFNYATMNAGKSTMLLQASYNYRERGMKTMLFTAALDNRAGERVIASRVGLEEMAETFEAGDDLYARIEARLSGDRIHCIFIDEAQFLSHEQVWQLGRVVDRLNVPIMAYGLRVDFQGNLFPGSQTLLAIADELREVRTICRCGRKATMVVRLDGDGKVTREGDQVKIGGNDTYVSLCRAHWEEEMGRVRAEDMIGFAKA
ncbi:thymidine kinase [Ahrensia kielensis]|uniref:thymidine kinase n=1 Tax=Ahrensia kielensis TaxID=76980 RepID=UPI0003706BBB|nr:thymidine kinase [Ahrensia kielensis]